MNSPQPTNGFIDVKTLTLEQVLDLKRQLLELEILKPARTKRPKHDYSSWDWTKRNIDLAREHDVSIVTVGNWRYRLGHSRRTIHYPACEKWDWTKSDSAIARENKVNIGSVRMWRVRLNKAAAPRDFNALPTADFIPSVSQAKVDWKALDWKKADIQIAREIGVTRERVRQVRASLGIPKNQFHIVKFEAFKKQFEGRECLTYEEANSVSPISVDTFAIYCSKLGITRIRKTSQHDPRYDLMNWDIPNVLLKDIWNIKGINSVAGHRCNHLLKKAAFRVVSVNGVPRIPAQFQTLVEAEKQKADEYRQRKSN